tara:strand:- start:1654 stop:1824 length:171 start_codon:yes stop_codon:yes gene_type:complete
MRSSVTESRRRRRRFLRSAELVRRKNGVLSFSFSLSVGFGGGGVFFRSSLLSSVNP